MAKLQIPTYRFLRVRCFYSVEGAVSVSLAVRHTSRMSSIGTENGSAKSAKPVRAKWRGASGAISAPSVACASRSSRRRQPAERRHFLFLRSNNSWIVPSSRRSRRGIHSTVLNPRAPTAQRTCAAPNNPIATQVRRQVSRPRQHFALSVCPYAPLAVDRISDLSGFLISNAGFSSMDLPVGQGSNDLVDNALQFWEGGDPALAAAVE